MSSRPAAQALRQSAPTEARAGRREWIGLAVIALPCLLYSMDLEVLHLAVPALTADLRPTSTQLLWIIDIYGFTLAGSLITMGNLGDRIGRRRLLLVGATAFGCTSTLAAWSSTPEMLIAARALLGVAGACLAPSTLSLISNMFHDPAQRGVAISVWAASFSVGAAAGPLLGGAMLERFWWGSVFLLAVPVMVLLLVVGPVLLPESKDPAPGRLDVASAGMSLAAILLVILGVKETAQHGPGVRPALVAAAGLFVGVAFLRRQRALRHPLVDLALFRSTRFDVALAGTTVSILAGLGIFVFVTQYLQLVLGLSPFRAGLWTVPSAVALIVGSFLPPVLARTVSPGRALALGLGVAAVGAVILTQVGRGPEVSSGLPVLVVGTTVLLLGVAPAVTLGTDLVVGAAPPEQAGTASGVSETGAELGGALGIAVLGSIGAAVYRAGLDAAAAPVPRAVADAARESLGAAVAVTDGMPAGPALRAAAQDAFVDAFAVAATAGAVMLALLAVATWRLLAVPASPARASGPARAGAGTADDRFGDHEVLPGHPRALVEQGS